MNNGFMKMFECICSLRRFELERTSVNFEAFLSLKILQVTLFIKQADNFKNTRHEVKKDVNLT